MNPKNNIMAVNNRIPEWWLTPYGSDATKSGDFAEREVLHSGDNFIFE